VPSAAVKSPAKSAAPAAPRSPAGTSPEPRTSSPSGAATGKSGSGTPTSSTAARTLDLDGLTEALRATPAIGFLTKLALKNQVDDLLDEFRAYHAGTSTRQATELRRSFELLVMKVLTLLQDKDPPLATSIASSREALWEMLVDPKKFATLPSR
jgi:hypothetical protein